MRKDSNGDFRRIDDTYYGSNKTVTWNGLKRTITTKSASLDGKSYSERTNTFNFGGVLKIAMIILLAATLFRFFGGSDEPKTFYSFLVMMRDVPEFISREDIANYFNLNFIVLKLPDNWFGDFFKPAVEFFGGYITFWGFIIKGATDTLMFVMHFLHWLFL